MNELISALGSRLASRYGIGSVYFGDVEESAIYPYIFYEIQSAGPTIYNSCNRNEGSIRQIAIAIHVWSQSSVTSGDYIADIIADIDSEKLSMENDKMLKADLIDHGLFVDSQRDQEGHKIWHGVCIFEFHIVKGYNYG